MSTATSRLFRTAARTALTRPLFNQTASIPRNFHTTSPKMVVHNLKTDDEFKAAIKDNKTVMLDCFATWCGPCKAIAPILLKHSDDDEFKDIFFAKIDVDELPNISQELGIRAMPTFMIFKDGEKAEDLVGANPNALVALLKKHA